VVEDLVEEVLKIMEQILLYVHPQLKQQLVVVMEIIQEVQVVEVMLVVQVALYQELLEQHVKVIMVEQDFIIQVLLEIITELVVVVELVEQEHQDLVMQTVQQYQLVELVKQLQ
jgi:hypothetical protein